MRSLKAWWVLGLALIASPFTVAQAACGIGADCVAPQYTAWCHARGSDSAGNYPPYTCSAMQSSSLGFSNYADDVAWSIRSFKNVYGYVSGTAAPAAPETLTYNTWPEPIQRHQRWDYTMMRSDGSTEVLNSANGGQRWGYCPVGFELNVSGQCERPRPVVSPKNLGCCAGRAGLSGTVGNPINVGVANKVQTEIDYVGSGAFPLEFVRTYNSLFGPYTTSFHGYWVSNYDRAVLPGSGPDDVIVTRRDGKAYFFSMVSDVGTTDADVTDRLYRLRDGLGSVSGWKYVTSNDDVELYDTAGKLSLITTREGYTQTFTYSDENTSAAVARYPGKLIAVTDSNGRSLMIAYDADNRVVAVTDPSGGIIRYTYDTRGNLSTRVDADGKTRTYLYNESGLNGGNPYLFYWLTGIVGEDGVRYASYAYDYYGKAISTEHAGGVDKVSITYGAGSATVLDANGATKTYGFTQLFQVPRLTSVQEPCPACPGGVGTRSVTLDSNGFANVATDTAGVTTDFDHNARGLEVRRIDSANVAATKRSTETDWHATLHIPTERRTYNAANILVAKSAWTYNTRGQPLTTTATDPATPTLTRTTATGYCEASDVTAGTCPLLGLVTSVNGPRTDVADTTQFTYYASDDTSCASAPTTCPHRKGDLWKVTNALGQVAETLAYDGAGRPRSVKDPSGVVTDMEYHPRGWLTAQKVRGPNAGSETDDAITRYEYTPTGLVSKITQPDGSYTVFGYDAAHRLTTITDNTGNQIVYTLDNAGQRTKEDTKDSGGVLLRTLSRVYNQLGQLQTGKDAYNHATGYVYDVAGNLDTTTDALSTVTDNTYDPLGRLTQTLQDTAGINAQTQFQYDALDRLTQVTDPKGLNTQYQYNGLGDLTQLTSPDTGVTGYSYDSAGNRATQTDARNETATYSYDALNRVVGIAYSDTALNVGYTYDTTQAICQTGETFSVGRLTRMDDGSGHTRYCYDRRGNVVRKVQTTNGQTFTLVYGYTLANQLASVTYPSGMQVGYTYNTLGQPSGVTVTQPGQSPQVLLAGVTYYPFGPAAELEYGDGRRLKRTHNQNYQPGVIEDVGPDGLSLGYEFDAVGNLIKLRKGDQSEPPLRAYAYDKLGRLTETRDGTSNALLQGYTYDATGNRTSKTDAGATQAYTYPSTSHRLAQVGATARSYDAVGNTAAIGGTAKEFIYTAANRMGQVKQSGNAVMNYAYNGKGEQTRRYPTATSTAQTYASYDEAGHTVGVYDYTGNRIQEVIWLGDLPIGVIDATKLHYVQADHLGTPRNVIDPVTEKSVWNWQLGNEAFGDSAPNQDPDNNGTAFVFDLRFPGQQYDATSGLGYNYFRDYDATVGRYVESDPIGQFGGVSTFSYAFDSPLHLTDEKGLVPSAAALEVIIINAVGRCLLGAGTSFMTDVLKQSANCCRSECGSWDIRECNVMRCLKQSVNCQAKNAAVAGCIVGMLRPELGFVAGWFADKYVGWLWPCGES
ncbi:MAG: RHS repeat protein [Lysobacter sp.]|nr:RHS repeat protein [Lysobacter sp.]